MKAQLLLVIFSLSCWSALCQPNLFQGEYRSGSVSPEKPFRILLIHYVQNGEFLFYFEGGTGAPDYNSEAIYGRLTQGDKPGHLKYLPKDTKSDWSLDFSINQDVLKVTWIDGPRFGNGVYPWCTYKRIKRANPAFFADRSAQQIYFDKTAPENYREK